MKLSSEAKAGVTILLSLILLVSMTLAVGNFDFNKDNAYEYTISYNTVDGLREGAPVRYAGVNVGSVVAIQLVPNQVLVRLRLDRELLIPADSRFVIANSGILGDKYIEIYPGMAQRPLEATTTIVGVDPVIIDDILVEVGSVLHTLNYAVSGFAKMADSAELQTSLVETGEILKETVFGLKVAVDQVANVAFAVEGIVEDVGEFSGQLPQLDLAKTFTDLEHFASELASLDLGNSIAQFDQFVAELNTIPIQGIVSDLQVVTNQLSTVPITEIGENVEALTRELAAFSIQELVSDLQVVTNELSNFGWSEMSSQLLAFITELSSFNLENILSDTIADLNIFAHNLASLELEALLLGVNDIVANLDEITTMVEPTSIANIVNDLEGISANFHGASSEVDQIIKQLNLDIRKLSDSSFVALEEIQKIVTGVEQSVANVNLFVDDLMSEGETAAGVKATLANVEDGTAELVSILSNFNESFSSETGGPLGELQATMDNIQKLNRDLDNIRTMGENVEIRSSLGASLNLLDNRRLMADVAFEFWPQDGNQFLLVGMSDILGEDGNHLQLQYGRQTGFLRQRYGIIDTDLGVGFDGTFADKWGLTAEIKALTKSRPKLSLGLDYSWTPDWVLGLELNNVLEFDGLSFGVERRF